MIDTTTILDVMRKGGSLDEAASACDVSLVELIDQAIQLNEVAETILKGVTFSRAWWSNYLRQHITQSIRMDAYAAMINEMNETVKYIRGT